MHGRVVATSAGWDDRRGTIYTYVTLDVRPSRGASTGAPARVVVKQLGGIVGDTAFVVGGQARFDVGEEVLVFLDVRPRDGTLSVAGLEQGKWLITGVARCRHWPPCARSRTRSGDGGGAATTARWPTSTRWRRSPARA